MNKLFGCALFSLAVAFLGATPAHANMGLPMLWVLWPAAWVLIVPIIGVEAFVATRVLGIGFVPTLQISAIGNLASTLLGIPLAWFFLVLLQLVIPNGGGLISLKSMRGRIISVTLQSAWLGPYDSELPWMVPAATMTLCLPFCVASVYSELLAVIYLGHQSITVPRLTTFEWQANLTSYGLIFCGLGVTVYRAVRRLNRERNVTEPLELRVIPPNLKVVRSSQPPDVS